MKTLFIATLTLCLLTLTLSAKSTQKKENTNNATVLHDGDGLTILYYFGHYYTIDVSHSEFCPCNKVD